MDKRLFIYAVLVLGAVSFASVASAAFTTVFQPQALFSGVNSTTTDGSAITLQSGDVVGYSTLVIEASTSQSVSLTLPASSTLASWLPAPGLRVNIMVFNATSTSGINLTIVGNTAGGSILENASTTAVITPQRAAIIDVMREPSSPANASTTVGNLLWTMMPAI